LRSVLDGIFGTISTHYENTTREIYLRIPKVADVEAKKTE
jgi:hypothetical protein